MPHIGLRSSPLFFFSYVFKIFCISLFSARRLNIVQLSTLNLCNSLLRAPLLPARHKNLVLFIASCGIGAKIKTEPTASSFHSYCAQLCILLTLKISQDNVMNISYRSYWIGRRFRLHHTLDTIYTNG